MKFNFIRNKKFIQIAIGLLVVIIVALIGFNFGPVIEGFNNTMGKLPSKIPCPSYSDCKSCTSYYWPTEDGPMMCEWDPKGKKCQTGEINSSQPDPGWVLNCSDTPGPTPGPDSNTCSTKGNRIGCLLSEDCVWDNGKCRIDDQPGFDKCAGNNHCIPCIMSGCYWSKIGGCAKSKVDASYSRVCKDLIAPDQEKCAKHTGCKMCVQDGCLWGGTPGYTPNCISPNTEHSETDYSRNCLQTTDGTQ